MTWFRVALFTCLMASGCAHRPPVELTGARDAYKHAAGELAEERDPAGVYVAGRSLQRAEREYEEHGDSEHARALAYVAMRKAQRLLVQARAVKHEAELAALRDAPKQPDLVAQLPTEPASPPQRLADSRDPRLGALREN